MYQITRIGSCDGYTIMHSLLVMMKSTKLQYLELQGIPSDASMFTLIVNGVQKKPVKGGSNGDSLLVPLLVRLDTEASNTGLGVKTSIELRYFSVQEPLDEEGSINFHTPQVTLPISVVTTELRLPRSYSYNFTSAHGGSTIQMDIPQSGRSYFFSRLLVVNTPLSLSVAYARPLG